MAQAFILAVLLLNVQYSACSPFSHFNTGIGNATLSTSALLSGGSATLNPQPYLATNHPPPIVPIPSFSSKSRVSDTGIKPREPSSLKSQDSSVVTSEAAPTKLPSSDSAATSESSLTILPGGKNTRKISSTTYSHTASTSTGAVSKKTASSNARLTTSLPKSTPTQPYAVISTSASGSPYELTFVLSKATAGTDIVKTNEHVTTTNHIAAGGLIWRLPSLPIGFPTDIPRPPPPPSLPDPLSIGAKLGCLLGCGGSNNDNGGDENTNSNNENNNHSKGKPKSNKQTTKHKSSSSRSSCSSRAIPICTQKVQLVTSISGTSTKIRSETSSECTTITECTGKPTTVITTIESATKTSSEEHCSPGCSACEDDDPPANTLPADSPTIAKRSLPTPAWIWNPRIDKWELDTFGFMMQMMPQTPVVPHRRTGVGSSAISHRLMNQRFTLGVSGLHGCTSVIVVSKARVWISHFWEGPSFDTDDAQFRADVLDMLDTGDTSGFMPGIRQFTGPGGDFAAVTKPAAVIVTAGARSGASRYRYPNRIRDIREKLENLMPGMPTPLAFDYEVRRADHSLHQQTPLGKVLFQYDPDQRSNPTFRNSPNQPGDPSSLPLRHPLYCNNARQKAIVRVWLGDNPTYIYQKTWYALIRQGGTALQRRDDSDLEDTCPMTIDPPENPPSSSAPKSTARQTTTSSKKKLPHPKSSNRSSTSTSTRTTKPPPVPTSTKKPSPPPSTPTKKPPARSTSPHKPTAKAPKHTSTTTKPPPPPPPHSPPYATGRCNVHVKEGLGEKSIQSDVYMAVNITDAKGALIGQGTDVVKWNTALSINSKLSNALKLTPQTGIKEKRGKRAPDLLSEAGMGDEDPGHLHRKRLGTPITYKPLFEKGPILFSIGKQSWDTTSKDCHVRGFENGNINDFFRVLFAENIPLRIRQIDCKFDC